MPGIPSTPNAVEIGARAGSTFRSCPGLATAYSCQPSEPSTMSPTATSGVRDSATRPTTPPVITPPISTGAAYDGPSRILPRMYGSSDSQATLTRTSPSRGRGIGASSSLKC